MELTPDEKIDMSLDDIIKIQLKKQMYEQNQRRWMNTTRIMNKRPYQQRNYDRWQFPMQRGRYPLMLFTKKYRQIEAFKRVQRAKYTLLQMNLRKRDEAYKRWEARSNMSEAGISSASAELDDVASNYSFISTRTNNTQTRLRNTTQWVNREMVSPVPSNLTVQVRNNFAMRSRLNRNRILQNRNFANRQLPGFGQQVLNKTRIAPRSIQGEPQARRMVVPVQRAPLTLNERFSMLQQSATSVY